MPEPQKIQKPTETKPPSPEPVIKTMPEKYIGAAAGKPPVVREVVETRTQAAVPPLPPPAPSEAAAQAKPQSRRRLIIAVSAILVILAGLGAAAFVIFTPAKPAAPPPKNTNAPERVCGNGLVEAGEECDNGGQNGGTGSSCSANCRAITVAPASICGNSIVESGEQCDIGSQNGANGSGCTASCQVSIAPPEVPNTGVDSDSDGLTDVEETSVYGTNAYNVDSDGDTFNDGNEVSHLYDPMKKAPSSLKDAASLRVIANSAEKYSVLVPAKWVLSGDNTAQLVAASPSGEFFEVLVQDKPKEQSLVEWYLALSPGSVQSEVERVKTLQGYDALRSPDRLTTFVDVGNGRVFTLTYSFDGQAHLELRTTYDAFVGSFVLAK